MYLIVEDEKGNIIVETDSFDQSNNFFDTEKIGELEVELYFSKRIFKSGKYGISIGLSSKQANKFQIESFDNFIGFEVQAETFLRDNSRIAMVSYIPHANWKWKE